MAALLTERGIQMGPMESPKADLKERARDLIRSRDPNMRIRILNVTRNTEVAGRAEVASSGAKRSKGLLGRKGLEQGEGMWIIPCEAVHTFFMQFPLDLIYLDRNHRVKKIRSNVVPWRVSACLNAHSILELPSGVIRKSETEPGDILEIEEVVRDAERTSPSLEDCGSK